MTHLRMTGHYDVPIDRVFELGTEFKRYPEWNVSYREVLEVTGPVDRVGTRIHAIMQVMGRKIDGWGEIVEVDRPRLLKFVGTAPDGGELTFTNRYTPIGNGTDFEFEIEYTLPSGLLGQIADKLFVERAVERDLRHSMENFKALVETGVPVLA